MEFWPEFMASSGGREFVAGGVGGMAGVLAGHPLDTLRVRLQQPPPPPVSPGVVDAPGRRPPSAARLLRGILRVEGPAALYRGMAAPLTAVAFQVSALGSQAAARGAQRRSWHCRRHPPHPRWDRRWRRRARCEAEELRARTEQANLAEDARSSDGQRDDDAGGAGG
jgi:hypothetical protein